MYTKKFFYFLFRYFGYDPYFYSSPASFKFLAPPTKVFDSYYSVVIYYVVTTVSSFLGSDNKTNLRT
jgi:hypothetical protein